MTNKQLNIEGTDTVESLVYMPLEKKYLKAKIVSTILIYLGIMIIPLVVYLIDNMAHKDLIAIVMECVVALLCIINLTLLPKACDYKGFAIREHDVSYRTGIIYHKVTTIPFCKIQQVSIRQSPVSRLFGLYAVDIVNGAQMLSDTTIPGLTEKRANEIKALITNKVKDENN